MPFLDRPSPFGCDVSPFWTHQPHPAPSCPFLDSLTPSGRDTSLFVHTDPTLPFMPAFGLAAPFLPPLVPFWLHRPLLAATCPFLDTPPPPITSCSHLDLPTPYGHPSSTCGCSDPFWPRRVLFWTHRPHPAL